LENKKSRFSNNTEQVDVFETQCSIVIVTQNHLRFVTGGHIRGNVTGFRLGNCTTGASLTGAAAAVAAVVNNR